MRQVLVETVDPVCGTDTTTRGRAGWRVDAPTPSAEYQGVIYRFCNEGCREAFEQNPGKYAKEPVST
jgi:YHS domain-containing protein